MRSSISPSDLRILLHEADMAARRLSRQLRLSRDDLADLRQDLLVDLIARLPAFDPKRGLIGAFAGLIMANRATRIARGVGRHRRMFGASPVSLDDPLPNGDGATRGDSIAEEYGLAAILGQPVDRVAEAERRIDLEKGLGTLDHDERDLVSSLYGASPHRLARSGLGSRSDLYRRTRQIRLSLIAAGLGRIANGLGRSFV